MEVKPYETSLWCRIPSVKAMRVDLTQENWVEMRGNLQLEKIPLKSRVKDQRSLLSTWDRADGSEPHGENGGSLDVGRLPLRQIAAKVEEGQRYRVKSLVAGLL